MTMKLLVLDTNVWLDYELGMRVGHDTAFKLVESATRNGVRLGMASHSLKDAFYIVMQLLKAMNRESGAIPEERATHAARQTAWGVLDHLMQLAELIGADYSDAWVAAKYRNLHSDYEDNLVVAAAIRAKADYLVTSDTQLLKQSPVSTLTPTSALEIIRLETS